MFFHLLSVLFALYVLPNVAVDQCNTTLSFDNVDDQEHPPPYRFYTNVSMSIVNWTRIHVVFQDPKIVNPDESLPSNRADLQYLRMPFEVTVKGGRVECMDFSAADNYWSTLIKRKVVNTLWLELEFNSTIYDCFCDDNGTFDEPSGWEKSDVSFCSLHRLGQLNVSEFAEAKNWTAEGYVTAVKDQETQANGMGFAAE
ncbi:hypothetical protein M3Y96_00033300 [Aphelenchoides besseyi]|nr:hypothetical protein M3Y96_00033300 [Aphelenchoides besseyi]